VLKALPVDDDAAAPSFAPHPIEDVVARIKADKPAVVFAPHVETSAGMILPDGYISQVAAAAHDVGALFALDCIASGAIWVDMQALGVDILCSAPQKGWSGPPCAGLVMLSDAAVARMGETTSTSFSCDLKKWHSIMDAYLNGGHAYHATMPTDALRAFRDVVLETKAFGYSEAKMAQQVLGDRVRTVLSDHGYKSVAADGFGAPGVTVSYTTDPNIKNGSAFVAQGMQIAAGVPLQVDEPEGFSTFRLGLFGLDKLKNIDRTVDTLASTLTAIEPN